MKKVRVIFFDAASTLIQLAESVGCSYARIAERLSKKGDRISEETFEENFLNAWRAMPERVPIAEAREDDDKGWWRDLVFRMLETMSINWDREIFFEEAYRYFARPLSWKPFLEVETVLETLQRQGLRLGVISNFDSRLFHILDGWNLSHRMERIIVSSRVGADKPHPQIFHYALRAFGVEAQEALHVGDHAQEDQAGAEAVGLQSFLIKRPEIDLREIFNRL
ncbi:MAG: HAD-IA family hydrolase [Verrucomicrobiae bacterium]|nr:HAD-IA family hydrolase [Verrucomicrobiae bacterium]